ncbi:MAG: hypothetical protein J3R72DRAFT_449708 [Linnemannia gamsii]|nr:MAG: hypothetical protein J3R72DRAFT_449708 [Linnemannia gamsii]
MSSSTSSAPSVTTTSSLSRADSLSSIEYLHGSHPLHHSHANRHLSGSVSGSTTTGSSTGSSFGHSVASGSVSSGGSSSVYLHHSTGLGRANLNAAIRHQRNPHDSAASSTAATTRIGGDTSSMTDGSQRVNGKSGSTSASASAGTEQGRNSTKRAAQNRAAQRAFRQRKDLYVRELERKAEMLQQAEGKILRLTARNRELEVALASGNPSSSSSLSPQQSPLHSHASPTTGLVCAAGSSPSSGDQEQQQPTQQPHQTLHHSSSREQLDRKGSEWSRGNGENPSSMPGRDPEFFDDSSSNHSGHSYPSSLSRATLARRSASQPMRSAYNASSPPLTNDSLKFHSLKQQFAANQPHSQPRHPQQQQHLPLRTDSDYEFEVVDQNPHRQLHRHPSEPSLNQSRRGSNSADSGDDYPTSGSQKQTQQHCPQDLSRSHGPRRSSVDSRMELTSPIFHNQQSSSLTYRPSNGISTGSRLLPSDYPESSSPPSSAQQYASNNGGSGNTQQQQQHERPPLYPIATQTGSRSAPLGSARSWSSGAQQEDSMKPHSPMMTSPVAGRSGGMAASAGSPTRAYGPGNATSRANDMEYLSDERPETNCFDGMNKRSSDGAISWSGSNGSGGRGGPPGPEPQSSPHAYSGGGLGLRKESSWSSFSAISKEGFNGSSGGGGGPSPISLPPVSTLAAVTAGRERGMSDDMEMKDSYHHPRPSQYLHQNHDGERRPSGTEANGNSHRGSMAMMADSPEMLSSLEGRFHNINTASSVTTPQVPGRQQQQQKQHFPLQQHQASPFAPQQQQQHSHQQHQQHHPQQRQHHPLSPANEYPTSTSEMDGVYDRHHHHQQQPHHQLRYHTNNHSGIAAGYHEEAMMRSP